MTLTPDKECQLGLAVQVVDDAAENGVTLAELAARTALDPEAPPP